MTVDNTTYDVVCVGGGISGLYTAKYMRAEGFTVKVLEAESDLGGVWRFKETPGGVIKSTITTSSRTVTESSDFHISSDGDFPTQEEMFQYINGYCDHFKLRDSLVFNAKVVAAAKDKEDGLWHVKDEQGREWKGKNLVVASGANTTPNHTPELDAKLESFPGTIKHSSVYKYPTDEYKDKRILLLGGGESAADIATELSYQSKNVHLSIPNGQWFGERTGGIQTCFPLEHFSSRLRRTILDGDKKPELFYLLKAYTEYIGGVHGHGLEIWRSPFDAYATSFINKNTAILERVKEGKAFAKPRIDHCEGSTAYFVDGSSAEFDIIMKCTGYYPNIDWLTFPEPHMEEDFCYSKLYKMAIHPEDTSLCFIGFARPVRGSIPSGAEMQIWLYSSLLAGKIPWPSEEEMKRVTLEEIKCRKDHFGDANKRLKTLVPVYDFCDDIARQLGVFPDYKAVLKEHGIVRTLNVLRAPFHMSQYRMNDPEGRKYHFQMIDRYIPKAPWGIIVLAVVGRILYTIDKYWPIIIAAFFAMLAMFAAIPQCL